jgi:fructose-bisphosphate aldolase class I
MNQEMFDKVKGRQGFIAALDQSGGSTPKALRAYGVQDDEWSGDDEMFGKVHEMRCRIITSKAFTGDRVLGAILFEDTMDRTIEGKDSADYLWSEKGVVPFLKVDKGLDDEVDAVQVMKPIPGLDDLLERAVGKGVFGTKMRSVVKGANANGIDAIVEQQFTVGTQILGHGLVPILEPEVDIHSETKAESEALLREGILRRLDGLEGDLPIMLKLTLPDEDGFYQQLVDHPKVLAVVALSGGYSRDEANAKLARNPGVIASFSRALTEGLTAQQSNDEFDAALDEAIQAIFDASVA